MRTFIYYWLLLFLSSAQTALADDPTKQAADADQTGGMTTLYALDPIAQKFSFEKAKYGRVIVDEVRLLGIGSDIDFGAYHEHAFTVAFGGTRLGKIIDLGTASELKKTYGYREVVGGGEGYASIHKKGGKVLIASPEHPIGLSPKLPLKENMFQPLRETKELFEKGESQASAAVKLGHIYVLRITDSNKEDFERVVKLLVTEYRPGESVTIRWQLLK